MFLNEFAVSSFSIPGTAVSVDIGSTNDSAILNALEQIKQKKSLVIEKPESNAIDATLAQANAGKWSLFLNLDISVFIKAEKTKKIVHIYSDNVLLTEPPRMHKIGKNTSWTISMSLGKPDIKHENIGKAISGRRIRTRTGSSERSGIFRVFLSRIGLVS